MNDSKFIKIINQLLSSILLIGIYKRHKDLEQARKLVLVNTISLMAIVILLVVGTISYARGNTMTAALDISAATLVLICIAILRITGRHQIPVYLGMSVMSCLYFYLFVTGGANNTGHLWYYTYPLFTLYIVGKLGGSVFNAILLIPSFIYLISMWSDATPQYPQDFTVRFIPSLTCLFIFSYLFESTRHKTHNKLQTKQDELEASIAALKQKEKELQRARDTLESQVEDRTRALRQSNQGLKVEIAQRKRSEERRKELEAKLVRAEKMQAIGTLAGGVAHDLNNILSGITSYPELLLSKIPQNSELRSTLETIHQSGQKAVAIVQDLLTLSRRSAAVHQAVDLHQIISDYLMSPEFEKMISFHKGVTVEKHVGRPPFTINGSEVHLSKTIMNLVANAVEAMPDGGKVVIDIANVDIEKGVENIAGLTPGRYVKLKVSDTGEGMSAEVLNRLFEPFFTTKKMGRSGSGLGMAVVWGTIQDHSGHIDVQSRPHEGTSFDLYFPAIVSDKSERPIMAVSLSKGNNESILVVDDVSELRQLATEILSQRGYCVHSVSSGEAAVRYLEDKHADLVILDMNMKPGIDGLETYRRILRFKPHQRAIVASGYAESVRAREVIRLGAKSYLKKPYGVQSILLAVQKALSD